MANEVIEEKMSRVDTELISETLKVVLWSLMKAQGIDLTGVVIENYRVELEEEGEGGSPSTSCWAPDLQGGLKRVPCP